DGGMVRTFTDITDLLTKERLSTLGQLTATVAHELRNPLSAIRNTLPVIQEMTLNKGVVLDRPVARIERSIARCDQLVTGLLDYTRPAVLNCKPTDIDVWLDNMRVIINLIDNAAQAIEQDQARAQARHTISVATRVGTQLEITIADNGPGIAPDVLPRIFEPLFSTKNFWYRSRVAHGQAAGRATPRHDLHRKPAWKRRRGSHRPSILQPAELGSMKHHVLIVDDDKDHAESIADLLQLRGYEVEVAYSGEEALELFRAHEPDVTVMDVKLPGMN